jgi:hypothetical protein
MFALRAKQFTHTEQASCIISVTSITSARVHAYKH